MTQPKGKIMGHAGFLKHLRAIEALEAEAEAEKIKLLRGSGWDYSSAYADCYWRWSKTIKDKVITTTDMDEALRLEGRISPCDEDCRHDD
jgi:hypothetical protein